MLVEEVLEEEGQVQHPQVLQLMVEEQVVHPVHHQELQQLIQQEVVVEEDMKILQIHLEAVVVPVS
jgi:hypothetical protein